MTGSPKKILIAITQSNFGGAQRYVYDLASALAGEGHMVSVALGGGGLLAHKLQEKGISIHVLTSLKRDVSILDDVHTFFEVYALLRKEKPDVLHLNSSKIAGIGSFAGRLAGISRIIFTAHGWEFNAPRSNLQRKLIRLFSECIVRFAHRTIAVSEAIKQAMPKSLQRKMTVIYNGVESIQFLSREEARAFLAHGRAFPPDEIWIGTVAELHPVKGLTYSIEAIAAAAKEKPIRYFVFGEGRERAKLERIINDLHMSDRIDLIGFVQDAPRYLKAFDIVVMPSLSEGLSYSVLEAGAAACAVIATRVGGLPEIIEPDINGILVPPKDTQALARAITALATDATKREELGRALHQRIERSFSVKTMVEKTIKLYQA